MTSRAPRHASCHHFVDHLLPEQKQKSLRKLLRGENVLVNLPTAYVKSYFSSVFRSQLSRCWKDHVVQMLLLSSRRFDRVCRPVTIFMTVFVTGVLLYFSPFQVFTHLLNSYCILKGFFSLNLFFIGFLFSGRSVFCCVFSAPFFYCLLFLETLCEGVEKKNRPRRKKGRLIAGYCAGGLYPIL